MINNLNNNYIQKNNINIFYDNFKSLDNILIILTENKIKEINIIDLKFLRYCKKIKENIPKIIINIFLTKIYKKIIPILNFNANIKCSNKKILFFYKNNSVNRNLIFTLTTVITFGTYDLYHIGHHNLLKRCKIFGNNVVVGISSDKLNKIKGKISIDKIDKRIKNVLDNNNNIEKTFIEESLEKKNEYCKKYNANILIMGDDWKGKFNWINCLCIYLPRTKNISSTLLKEKIKNSNYKHKFIIP